MIFRESILFSADNSGAKKLKCVNILGKIGCPNYGIMGSVLVVVVLKLDIAKKIKKRIIYYALVISVRRQCPRLDGTYITFFQNRAILFNNVDQDKFLGTRIYGGIAREARNKLSVKKHKRVLSFVRGTL